MKTSHGHLVISLDFELFWGVFDVRTLESYKANLHNVITIIPRLLALSDAYNIKLSFATVGFLFAKNKEELIENSPQLKPTFTNSNFNPYRLIENIGYTEPEDPFHYAQSLIKRIQNNGNHEIGSHTFCHYYCNEKGQNSSQFEADLKATIASAKRLEIDITSIVFPRNQINSKYLEICTKYGITSYRGIEKHWMYSTINTKQLENPLYRGFRLLDNYINLSGFNTNSINELKKEAPLVNIPSSRFLRPYNKSLRILEPLKVSRIKKGMTYAAKNNEVYHLWWHPHNFGENIDNNFIILEQLFKHYQFLNNNHNFKSETMTGLSKIVISSEK
jgi:peptidoglycan/xylan/chitin deacetylase (PgdA/CDA1 family)